MLVICRCEGTGHLLMLFTSPLQVSGWVFEKGCTGEGWRSKIVYYMSSFDTTHGEKEGLFITDGCQYNPRWPQVSPYATMGVIADIVQERLCCPAVFL